MKLNRSRLAIATITGFLLLAGTASQAGGVTGSGPARIDLTASAQPQRAFVPLSDSAFHVDFVEGVSTHAATTATASAICDGCAGIATAVQVLYADRSPALTLDNVAVAWDQGCIACRATAVSLQVVVVNDSGSLTPNNRSLALNAACKLCNARSGAYQLVVSFNGQDRLSSATLRSLKQWTVARAKLLRTTSTSVLQRSGSRKTQGLRHVAHLVNSDLGSKTVAKRARVSVR
jgi:hypothetical protein